MKIQTSGFFSSAHFLDDYEGKCKNIHGHTYAYYIEGVCMDSRLMDDMVFDFGIVKRFDHTLMVNRNSEFYQENYQVLDDFKIILFDCNPTAERIALRIKKIINDGFPNIVELKVRVWEDIESLIDQRMLKDGDGEFVEVV